MNSKMIWGTRLKERMKEMSKYLRYMLNGHLLFVLIIALGAGAYYYQQWVESLSESFPAEWMFIPIFTYLLTTGTIITFLKEPDKVFLLPFETKMNDYFKRSFMLSFGLQSYYILMVFLVGAPLFHKTIELPMNTLLFLLILIFLKGTNLFIRFFVDYDKDNRTGYIDFWIRLLLNGAIIYFLFQQSTMIYLIILIVLLIAYTIYFYQLAKDKSIHWDKLISIEEKKMATFYRLANLFTDVPKLKNKIKRRKLLDVLYKNIRYSQKSTFTFLFMRSFIRNGDYFGLVLRLTIIGSVLIAAFQWNVAIWLVGILFLYLTAFQLLSLWKIHDLIIWPDLYPIDEQVKKRSFLRIIFNIVFIQNVIFSLVVVFKGLLLEGILLFLFGSIFTYGFIYMVSSSTIKKWSHNERS